MLAQARRPAARDRLRSRGFRGSPSGRPPAPAVGAAGKPQRGSRTRGPGCVGERPNPHHQRRRPARAASMLRGRRSQTAAGVAQSMRARRLGVTLAGEALLFDLGRVVISRFQPRGGALGRTRRRRARSAPRAPCRTDCRREALSHHERGEISDAAFFAHLAAELNLDLTDAQLRDGWNAIFVGELLSPHRRVFGSR